MIFVLDENISKYVAHGLSLFQNRLNKRNGTNHQVHSSVDLLGAEIKDPELFRNLPESSVLLTFDINQQRKWQERIAIKRAKLNVIYLRFNANLSYWQMVLLFINAWRDILSKSETYTQPFLIRYKPRDVRKFIRR